MSSKLPFTAFILDLGHKAKGVTLADLGQGAAAVSFLMGGSTLGHLTPNDNARDRVPQGDGHSAPAAIRK